MYLHHPCRICCSGAGTCAICPTHPCVLVGLYSSLRLNHTSNMQLGNLTICVDNVDLRVMHAYCSRCSTSSFGLMGQQDVSTQSNLRLHSGSTQLVKLTIAWTKNRLCIMQTCVVNCKDVVHQNQTSKPPPHRPPDLPVFCSSGQDYGVRVPASGT